MSSRKPQLSWRAAIRIAWREMRASRAKFLFVVLSVAIGVGSLTGVRGFSTFLPPHAAGRGAHPDGGRSDGARLRPAHAGAGGGAPRPGSARRAAHLDHRDGHHGIVRLHARPAADFGEGGGPRRVPVLRRGEAESAAAAARGAGCAIGGRLRRSAGAPQRAHRRPAAHRRPGFSHRRRHGVGTGPHDGQPQRGAARDDHARRAWTAPA